MSCNMPLLARSPPVCAESRASIVECRTVQGCNPAACFFHEDVAGADVPIVEFRVDIRIQVGFASRDLGQLHAGGIGLQHFRRL